MRSGLAGRRTSGEATGAVLGTEIRTRSGHRAARLDPVAVDSAGLAAWRNLADRAAEPIRSFGRNSFFPM